MRNKKAEKTFEELMNEFKRIRQEKGLSHEKLALMCGLNRSAISLLESKKRTPTILTCLKICDALNVALPDLLKSIQINKPLN